MRFPLVCMIALLCAIPFASAATSTATAVVSLEIINAPPRIVSLTISLENPAMHESIACIANISDEHPDQNTLTVAWLHGDTLISTGEFIVPEEHDLAPGDELSCIARATDEEGSRSNALIATAILTETTLADRISGLASITGSVVAGQPNGGASQNSILVAILVVLFALNAVLTAKHIRRKKSR